MITRAITIVAIQIAIFCFLAVIGAFPRTIVRHVDKDGNEIKERN